MATYKHRNSHCFVPGCTTGYRTKEKVRRISLFRVPKNPLFLNKWKLAIRRKDRDLDETCAVCELHFINKHIIRHFTHIINGKVVSIARERPILAKDAVPCIFPDLPEYRSKNIPHKRLKTSSRNRNVSNPVIIKISGKDQNLYSSSEQHKVSEVEDKFDPLSYQLHENSEAEDDFFYLLSEDTTSTASEVSQNEELDLIAEKQHYQDCDESYSLPQQSQGLQETSHDFTLKFLDKIKMPSIYWGTYRDKSLLNVVAFGTSRIDLKDNSLHSYRLVIVERNRDGTLSCKVSIKGVPIKFISVLESKDMLEETLRWTDTASICVGAGKLYEFPVRGSTKNMMIVDSTVFNQNCSGVALSDQRERCDLCRYLRKLLLNKKSRLKNYLS